MRTKLRKPYMSFEGDTKEMTLRIANLNLSCFVTRFRSYDQNYKIPSTQILLHFVGVLNNFFFYINFVKF